MKDKIIGKDKNRLDSAIQELLAKDRHLGELFRLIYYLLLETLINLVDIADEIASAKNEEPSEIARIEQSAEDSSDYVIIYESELQLMAGNAYCWGKKGKETGGALFGCWTHGGRLIIFFVTPPGPDAIHEELHFRQDIRYLKTAVKEMNDNFGILFSGDYHRHVIDLTHPSEGDINHIRSISSNNNIERMVEIIITSDGTDSKSQRKEARDRLRINPFIYFDAPQGQLQKCRIKVLPGTSPIRTAIESREGEREIDLSFSTPAHPMNLLDYEKVDEHESNTSDKPVSERILEEIRSLPEDVLDNMEISLKGEIVSISLPLLRSGERVFVEYSNDSDSNIKSIFYKKPSSEVSDITAVALKATRTTSLSKIYRTALDISFYRTQGGKAKRRPAYYRQISGRNRIRGRSSNRMDKKA